MVWIPVVIALWGLTSCSAPAPEASRRSIAPCLNKSCSRTGSPVLTSTPSTTTTLANAATNTTNSSTSTTPATANTSNDTSDDTSDDTGTTPTVTIPGQNIDDDDPTSNEDSLCASRTDDDTCLWCSANNDTEEAAAKCLKCYRGADFSLDRSKEVKWENNACVCFSEYYEPKGQPVENFGCQAVPDETPTDHNAYCADFREANRPECMRCLRECGPSATWTDAAGAACINKAGTRVKSWDNCLPM